ncbi:competence protein CoiA family protein [Streptomyces chrestomyceticus]|uniref:Competence protein CoiA family protein n=1 Tax=Streptomyces chrestomyceticus TaxID=68185 RepID=A0ABU7X1B9_9ACTN
MLRDQRLVQTAVLGSAESEVPVVLPMRAGEVAVFQSAHEADTYWCGRWLGGCGGRLTIKPYQDRVCHFAHVAAPGRGPCRRAAVGVGSADHLYIKQQILAWLAEQSITAHASMPEMAGRLGGEVLFEPGGHGCLRVLLDLQTELPAVADGTQLLLGPNVTHDPYRLAVDGYVLRIRCDSDAAGRRVMIGTQTHDGIQWVGLDECRLTSWGLSTPAVEQVRRLRSTVQPLGTLPHRPAPAVPEARPVAAPQAHEDRAAVFAALQQTVEADRGVSELRRFLTHAESAVHGGASAEENDLLRRATDLLLRKERGVGVSAPRAAARRRGRRARQAARPTGTAVAPVGGARQAAEAVADLLDVLERRRAHLTPGEQKRLVAQLTDKARKADLWLTGRQRKKITAWENNTAQTAPRPEKKASTSAPPPSSPVPAGAKTPAPNSKRKPNDTRRKTPPSARPTDLTLVADAARDVLEHAARLGRTVPWEQLCAQVKGMKELSEEQQIRVLDAVIARSRSALPLTALITTTDGNMHPHYQQHLDREARQDLPGNDATARTAWQAAITRVHNSY